jgi:hypothetical protein
MWHFILCRERNSGMNTKVACSTCYYLHTYLQERSVHTEAISGRTISWASRRDVAEEWWHIFYLMRRLNNTYMNTIVYVVMRQHFSRATKKWKRFCFGSHNQNVAQPKCCLRQNFIFLCKQGFYRVSVPKNRCVPRILHIVEWIRDQNQKTKSRPFWCLRWQHSLLTAFDGRWFTLDFIDIFKQSVLMKKTQL